MGLGSKEFEVKAEVMYYYYVVYVNIKTTVEFVGSRPKLKEERILDLNYKTRLINMSIIQRMMIICKQRYLPGRLLTVKIQLGIFKPNIRSLEVSLIKMCVWYIYSRCNTHTHLVHFITDYIDVFSSSDFISFSALLRHTLLQIRWTNMHPATTAELTEKGTSRMSTLLAVNSNYKSFCWAADFSTSADRRSTRCGLYQWLMAIWAEIKGNKRYRFL